MSSSKLSMGDQCVDFENSFSKFHEFKHGVLVIADHLQIFFDSSIIDFRKA